MRTTIITRALTAMLCAVAAPAWAQHEGHGTPGAPAAAVNPAQVAACVQSQQQVMALVDAASQRIDLARQTNEPAALRNAIDEFQAALSAVRAQLVPCAQMTAGAPAADPHAGHAMPDAASVQPSSAAQPAMPCCAPQADLIKDPGCRADVDPTTAPRASHEGRSYYFCSESDRQRFVADPARYLQAAPAASPAADPHAGHTMPGAAAAQAAPPGQPRQAGGIAGPVIAFRSVPSPARGAAENEFEVTVTDRQGRPVDGADVSIALVMPAMPAMKMPEMRNEVRLQAAGNGRYTGRGQVMMAGAWTVTVSVRQNGKEIGQQKAAMTAK